MLDDTDEETEEPTAEFKPGHTFHVTVDRTGRRYFVEDEDGALVALLPQATTGAMLTKAGQWQIGAERQAHRWSVVARTDPGAPPVGHADPHWLPDAYKLRLSAGSSAYTLRMSWVTGAWRLRRRGVTIARLTPGPIRLRSQRGGKARVYSPSSIYPAAIELARDRTGVQQLPLLIGLALAAFKCERQIPHVSAGSGG